MSDLALPPDRVGSPEENKGETEVQEVSVVQGVDRLGGSTKSSWVEVATDKKALKRYDVEVSTKDGVHMIEIPDEILENSTPLWEDFVVGKFLDLAPHVAKVHMVLNKIWRYGDPSTKVEVYEVNPTTMRFKVSSHKAREKILRRGMWNIVGVPMIVSKWSPKVEDEKQEEEAIPMWVHLEKVPLHMYSWEGLSFVTSPVGLPVKLHSETIACTNFEEAKVFVKVDVSKTLPKEITFSKEGKLFKVKYYYPWLPARCSFCDKWGHGESVCAKKGKEKKNKVGSCSPRQVEGSAVKGMSLDVHKVQQGGSSKLEGGKLDVENVIDDKEVSGSVEMVSDGSEVNVNAWARVSPGKTGKVNNSGNKSSEGIQISASKYSVLDKNEEEEGEIIPDEDEVCVGKDQLSECDLLEDEILDQQDKEKIKSGRKKGRGRGQKARTQAVNTVKSIRSSRRIN